MTSCTICNVCDRPGTLAQAGEVGLIRSNVRKFRKERFTVWRCAYCHSLHSAEAVDLDFYYRHYPVSQHRLDPVTRLAYHQRLRLLKRYGFNREARLLDFGCGAGVFVRFLRQYGYTVVGYDTYISYYANAHVLQNQYQVVTAYDVIEHVSEPRQFLAELVQCLRPGGLLVLATPVADPITLTDPETFLPELHQPYHRHILSERALRALGAQAGLEVAGVDPRFAFDTPVPFVNWRFGKAYLRQTGNLLDVLFERPRPEVLLAAPGLLFDALFGYFFPPPGYTTVFFRRT